MFFGWIIAILAGGVAGWWFGTSRAKAETNRQWMRALEQAKTDNLIDEETRSELIRIQGALADPRRGG
jgi:hypothetical protein